MPDLSRDYLNSAFIPQGDSFYPRWQAKALAFRQALGSRAVLDQPYGPGARQKFDLFLPEGQPHGLMVFVHGGYWLACSREDYSHLAAGAVARGWACALPSYTLAPEGRISGMVAEVATAIRAASERVAGPVVVTGHSAGGHLSARMGCADIDLPRVVRVVPISPLADLEPLTQTDMQPDLRISPEEIASESPARLPLRKGCEAHVWVGGQERPVFLWHARKLSEDWNCDWTVAKGLHHFDVIDDLELQQSALIDTCIGGL